MLDKNHEEHPKKYQDFDKYKYRAKYKNKIADVGDRIHGKKVDSAWQKDQLVAVHQERMKPNYVALNAHATSSIN